MATLIRSTSLDHQNVRAYCPSRLTQCILCIFWPLIGTKVASGAQRWRPIQAPRSTYASYMQGMAFVACQDCPLRSLFVHAPIPRGELLFHGAGRSTKWLLDYCPTIKPRWMTALAYIQPLRGEVLWHPARRFVCDAAELSHISVILCGILQRLLVTPTVSPQAFSRYCNAKSCS